MISTKVRFGEVYQMRYQRKGTNQHFGIPSLGMLGFRSSIMHHIKEQNLAARIWWDNGFFYGKTPEEQSIEGRDLLVTDGIKEKSFSTLEGIYDSMEPEAYNLQIQK